MDYQSGEKINKDKFRYWIILAVILAAASFLRLSHLGRQSFWVDEINVYYAAQSFNAGEGLNMPSGFLYGRAPVYTYCAALFSKIIGPGEVATRLPSAIFGILGVWLIYVIGARMFDRKTALVAALLLAFSHFAVGWSRTAKMYTMLQFLTLAVAYSFILGFEPEKGKKRFLILPSIEKKWDFSLIWIAATLLLGAYTFYKVHRIFAIFILGLFVYVLVMAVIKFIFLNGRERFFNKYMLISAAAIILTAAAVIFIPWIRANLKYYLAYTPEWVKGDVGAKYRLLLFDFIMSVYRFPMGALFFAGAVLVIFKGNKRGIFSFILFTFQLFMLSFVFTHRVPMYLFNVYPFFIFLAAYSLVWFVKTASVESENSVKNEIKMRVKKLAPYLRYLISLSVAVVFLVSPWMRISLNIPKIEDGKTNMAVTPGEWKAAGKYLRENMQKGDVVISNLPQISSFYCPATDYTLNFGLLRQSMRFKDANKNGRWVDIYEGVPCIENLEDLKKIISTHKSGWIVLEKYLFNTDAYTSGEIREYVKNHFEKPIETKNYSLLIYSWGEAADKGGNTEKR